MRDADADFYAAYDALFLARKSTLLYSMYARSDSVISGLAAQDGSFDCNEEDLNTLLATELHCTAYHQTEALIALILAEYQNRPDSQPFSCRVAHPDVPGQYCFPPMAALITGAARLMLALLERSVTDLGGTYAMEDTDSMAIVATEIGGFVECVGGPHRTDNGKPVTGAGACEAEKTSKTCMAVGRSRARTSSLASSSHSIL